MKISVGGLAKARENALVRLNAHFNKLAHASAHDDAVDLRRRLNGERRNEDPVLAREAERQRLADIIEGATSIDDLARLVKEWDDHGIR